MPAWKPCCTTWTLGEKNSLINCLFPDVTVSLLPVWQPVRCENPKLMHGTDLESRPRVLPGWSGGGITSTWLLLASESPLLSQQAQDLRSAAYRLLLQPAKRCVATSPVIRDSADNNAPVQIKAWRITAPQVLSTGKCYAKKKSKRPFQSLLWWFIWEIIWEQII